MSNFETDNQDKSNLVGDAKLMSDAVDVEQERLALIDEVRELKADWSANLETKKALMFSLEHVIKERDKLEEKAKAWDDLEAFMDKEGSIEISINISGRIFIDDFNMGETLKESISNALKSIKGES